MDHETLDERIAALTDGQRLVLQRFDASVLLDIYLDGFTTGAATAALAMLDDQDKADQLARMIAADPIAMETIRKEIFDRLRGVNDGPHTIVVNGGGS